MQKMNLFNLTTRRNHIIAVELEDAFNIEFETEEIADMRSFSKRYTSNNVAYMKRGLSTILIINRFF